MNSLIENTIHEAQNGNSAEREALIIKHMDFIRKTGSKVCGRRIDIHDDEMSICLIAFNQALNTFKMENKVPFKSYASVVIRNKLIDYLRQENRHRHLSYEISSNDATEEETYSPAEIKEAVKVYQLKSDAELRKLEIKGLAEILNRFDITWMDLLEHCPKHKRKRKLCLKASNILANDSELWSYFWRNKLLPIKRLSETLHVSRKVMERSRKYVAATAVLIKYKKDYPLLYEYIRDELERG
jgi:RNA polymerase sigma factor